MIVEAYLSYRNDALRTQVYLAQSPHSRVYIARFGDFRGMYPRRSIAELPWDALYPLRYGSRCIAER